ncbi:MAG: hypothetical protein MZU84_00745 [Sphingobacterium sp.]|nr:hypothetical protein [Sphingobacterium sp.]
MPDEADGRGDQSEDQGRGRGGHDRRGGHILRPERGRGARRQGGGRRDDRYLRRHVLLRRLP